MLAVLFFYLLTIHMRYVTFYKDTQVSQVMAKSIFLAIKQKNKMIYLEFYHEIIDNLTRQFQISHPPLVSTTSLQRWTIHHII